MANFELFLMIYVLVFYYEIRRMPGEAGYCFYGLVTAGMLGVAAVLGAHLHGLLPWELNLTLEQAEYDLILNLAFATLCFSSMFYMKRKPALKEYKDSGFILTPQLLTKLLGMLRFRSVLNGLWRALVALVIILKVIPGQLSTAWTVFLGVVAFGFVFSVLCSLKMDLLDEDSPFAGISEEDLKKLESKAVLTEEEQAMLKEKIVKAELA